MEGDNEIKSKTRTSVQSNQVKSCWEGRKNESLWRSLSEWREIRRGGRNRLMVPDKRDLSKLL